MISDANIDNVYSLTASVSDGSLSDSKDFTVTVTNDTSDDVTTAGMDGVYIGPGPIQSATVCIEVTAGTCTGATYSATTAQDGTFSLTVDSDTSGVLRGEGGFDPAHSEPWQTYHLQQMSCTSTCLMSICTHIQLYVHAQGGSSYSPRIG